ncbi:GNAT family N-acetyltransferase [Pseudactinotalea sp. HY158]|uniref:GNAT family N-acetyltransferase n=1 Tax=unclassified Pseudactinotalea TaxID=2649176 RepID=UPI0018843D73|nr:GNAT family N-acetyltransferase [Pseudactinotalea sp. HY158]
MAWGNLSARRAVPGDFDDVLEILRLARADSPLGPHLCSPDGDRVAEQLAAWFELADTHLVVAESDDRIMGITFCQIVDTSVFADLRFLQIEAVFVHPEFRRRGVGRMLMTEVAHLAVEVEAERIVTIVLTGARSEQRFLAGLGFGPAGSRRIVDTTALLRRLEVPVSHRERRVRGFDDLIARRRRSRELTAAQH